VFKYEETRKKDKGGLMILTSDEAVRLLDNRLRAVLRRKEIEPMTTVEMNSREDNNQVRTIAKGIIKSTRPVRLVDYKNKPELLEGHGFRSINGIKHHIVSLYGQGLWDSFEKGSTLYRMTFDYSFEKPKEEKK